jgi:hypothetical protein
MMRTLLGVPSRLLSPASEGQWVIWSPAGQPGLPRRAERRGIRQGPLICFRGEIFYQP